MNNPRRIHLLTIACVGIVSLCLSGLGFSTVADAQPPFPVWDTAWELSSNATLDEADTYFAYIASRGYDGVWMSYLSQEGIEGTSGLGNRIAQLDSAGNIVLDPNHVRHVRGILDRAQKYGLDVVMVAAWGSVYLNEIVDSDGDCVLNNGILSRGNARAFGQELGSKIGSHPALETWVLGGDNWCDRDSRSEDPQVWINMKAGLRAVGSNQPTGYHTGGWEQAILKFIDEPWIDFFAVQTSHCRESDEAVELLNKAMARTDRPVLAAEMRYEAIAPPWCDADDAGPDNPVKPDAILDDARAAHQAGLAGYVYGHNERWLWGSGEHGSTGNGFASVQASFFAPGEQLMLDYFGRGRLPNVTCNGHQATILGSPSADTLLGTPGRDVFAGAGGNDLLLGFDGDDLICGGSGDDIINGGPGTDVLFGDAGNDVLRGGPGNDPLLRGGVGNDTVTGEGGNDTIYGDAGNDKLNGSRGNDVIWGGAGNDKLKGGSGNDVLEGEAGRDRLVGGRGDDQLNGGRHRDLLKGGSGTDRCTGGGGKDKIHRTCER